MQYAFKYWLGMTSTVVIIAAIMWKVCGSCWASSAGAPGKPPCMPCCACSAHAPPTAPLLPPPLRHHTHTPQHPSTLSCFPPSRAAPAPQAVPDGPGPLQDAYQQGDFFLVWQPIYASITVAICLQDTVSGWLVVCVCGWWWWWWWGRCPVAVSLTALVAVAPLPPTHPPTHPAKTNQQVALLCRFRWRPACSVACCAPR